MPGLRWLKRAFPPWVNLSWFWKSNKITASLVWSLSKVQLKDWSTFLCGLPMRRYETSIEANTFQNNTHSMNEKTTCAYPFSDNFKACMWGVSRIGSYAAWSVIMQWRASTVSVPLVLWSSVMICECSMSCSWRLNNSISSNVVPSSITFFVEARNEDNWKRSICTVNGDWAKLGRK